MFYCTIFFIIEANYETWSDCSEGSSLTWVHTVCNFGFISASADKTAGDKSWIQYTSQLGTSHFYATFTPIKNPECMYGLSSIIVIIIIIIIIIIYPGRPVPV